MSIDLSAFPKHTSGTLIPGYQVASGQAQNSPYPDGTIKLQRPHFSDRGLDLSSCYPGTLNISIEPYTFSILETDHTFRNVAWSPLCPPEDFSFVRCVICHQGRHYNPAWIYYPHPETKPQHIQKPTTLEILAPHIPDITYGHSLQIHYGPTSLHLYPPGHTRKA